MQSNGLLTKKLRTTNIVNPWVAISAALPALIAIVFLGLVPAIVNIVISFTDYSGIYNDWGFVGLKNYTDAFTFQSGYVSMWSSLQNTIFFSFFTVIIQQCISFIVALILAGKLKGKSFFRSLFFMPTILGISVIGFVWQLILDPISGPISMFLQNFGIESALLGEEGVAMWLVIAITVWANFGYSMVIYIAGIQDIPSEVKEAATMDGANLIQRIRYITLPLLKNTFVINFWISISGTLAMFDLIFVLTNGTAGTMTFSLFFFKLATNNAANQGQAAALSIYFFIFVTAVMLTFNAVFRRKEKEV